MINRVKTRNVLTEKQREIILRKAEFLGESLDEVKLTLESIPLIPEMTTNEIKRKEDIEIRGMKEKRIRKCPACGADINDVYMKCPDCGYVFTGTPANVNLIRFGEELKHTTKTALKKQIIESVTIPNDKEDLLDFLLILRPQIEGRKGKLYGSYLKKYTECINRARQFFSSDEDFAEHFRLYDFIVNQKIKRKRNLIISFIILPFLIAGIIYLPSFFTQLRFQNTIKNLKKGLDTEDSLAVKRALHSIKNVYENDSDYNVPYGDISQMLKETLLQKAAENENVGFAYMLLNAIYQIPESYRWTGKRENWECVKAVSEMYFDRYMNVFDVLKLFNEEYPNDQALLQYDLRKKVEIGIIGGNKEYSEYIANMAFLYFSAYSQDIQEAVYKELVKMIESATEYYSRVYRYYTTTPGIDKTIKEVDGVLTSVEEIEIAEIDDGIRSKYGIEVGDIIISREMPLRSKIKAAVLSGKLFKHTILHNGDTLRVDLPYQTRSF